MQDPPWICGPRNPQVLPEAPKTSGGYCWSKVSWRVVEYSLFCFSSCFFVVLSFSTLKRLETIKSRVTSSMPLSLSIVMELNFGFRRMDNPCLTISQKSSASDFSRKNTMGRRFLPPTFVPTTGIFCWNTCWTIIRVLRWIKKEHSSKTFASTDSTSFCETRWTFVPWNFHSSQKPLDLGTSQ